MVSEQTPLAMVAGQVDCIVRMHNPVRLIELQRCVLSLYGQCYRPLRVIVATQRFTTAQLQSIEALLAPLKSWPDAPFIQVYNYEPSKPVDARSALLNLGISHATGQYLGFLDYDDTLYQDAYTVLVDRLQRSDAAIAFASVRAVNASVHASFVYPTGERANTFRGQGIEDLMIGNFCPIHSYLIERRRVAARVLHFDPTLTVEEDYDLLLRICSAYGSDFSALGIRIGDYYFKDDGSNTTQVGAAVSEQALKEYEWVSARIQARRVLGLTQATYKSAASSPPVTDDGP